MQQILTQAPYMKFNSVCLCSKRGMVWDRERECVCAVCFSKCFMCYSISSKAYSHEGVRRNYCKSNSALQKSRNPWRLN